MNRLGLYLTGFFLSIFFLTSCLKGSNVQEGWVCGVISVGGQLGMSAILKTPTGDLYSSNLVSAINNGDVYYDDCLLVYYRLDSDLPENGSNVVETNGYYTVSVLQYIKLEKFFLRSYLTDISTVLPGEKPIVDGFVSGDYIDKYLFITQIANHQSDMELQWEMSYDYSSMPTDNESNKRFYDLYIRATVKKESTNNSKSDVQYFNAYYMNDFFMQAATIEKTHLGSNYNPNSSKFNVRFNYVIDCDGETNTLTWKTHEIEEYIIWFIPD